MNERIKQLLDQAQDLAREEVKNTPELAKYAPSYAIPGTEIHVGLRLSYEKFAELIVRECLAHGKLTQSQAVVNGSEEYNAGREMGIEVFMNQIKKHFGVKE
jgi:hypothetical protein